MIRAVRLEAAWDDPGPTALQARELLREENQYSRDVVQLIPGGRWLLVGTSESPGRVDYYDLDRKNPSPRVLISPSKLTGPGGPNVIHVDMRHSPVLSFNLLTLYDDWGKFFYAS